MAESHTIFQYAGYTLECQVVRSIIQDHQSARQCDAAPQSVLGTCRLCIYRAFVWFVQTISETERVVREAMTAPRRANHVKLDSDSLIEDAILADAQGKGAAGRGMW